jgi:hypothetical protein
MHFRVWKIDLTEAFWQKATRRKRASIRGGVLITDSTGVKTGKTWEGATRR